jgi:hypothetical protein
MAELLPEVMIKEVSNTGVDKVVIVRNLPKKFIYQKVVKMVQKFDRDGYSDGMLVPDPKGEMEDGLYDHLEHSQNGDGSIHFMMHFETARKALEAIDQYISGTLPRDVIIPKRVPYALDPSDMRSAPKPRHMIPVIELPVSKAEAPQVSPEAQASLESSAPIKKYKLTPAQREAAKERLARAREIRKQQIINAQNAPKA